MECSILFISTSCCAILWMRAMAASHMCDMPNFMLLQAQLWVRLPLYHHLLLRYPTHVEQAVLQVHAGSTPGQMQYLLLRPAEVHLRS